MGRLLFMIFVAVVLILVVMVVNSYLNKRGNKTNGSNRKNFDEDIEAVAKEIKMRREA